LPASLTPIPGSQSNPTICFVDQPSDQWAGTSYEPLLFALTNTGSEDYYTPIDGLPVGAVYRFAAPLAGAPVQVALPQGEGLVFGLVDGSVTAMTAVATDIIWHWTWSDADTLSFAPVVGEGPDGSARLLCAATADALYLIDAAGAPVGAPVSLGPPGEVSDLTARPLAVPWQPAASYLVFTASGWFRVDQDAGGL